MCMRVNSSCDCTDESVHRRSERDTEQRDSRNFKAGPQKGAVLSCHARLVCPVAPWGLRHSLLRTPIALTDLAASGSMLAAMHVACVRGALLVSTLAWLRRLLDLRASPNIENPYNFVAIDVRWIASVISVVGVL